MVTLKSYIEYQRQEVKCVRKKGEWVCKKIKRFEDKKCQSLARCAFIMKNKTKE